MSASPAWRASIAVARRAVKGERARNKDSVRRAVAAAMPLLPKEPDLFPEELFTIPEAAAPWYVAHVRSRQEKTLARRLLERQVPFYLPTIERVAERSSRRFRSYMPLFPGYVFLRGREGALDVALRSGVTVNMIEVSDQQLLSGQLEQIRRLQLAGASFEIYDELLPNDPVTITEGPFRGYMGTVVRSGRGDRLVVSLSLLRKNVAVEFERRVLRRARQ